MSAYMDKSKGFRFLGENDYIIDIRDDLVVIGTKPADPFKSVKKNLTKLETLHIKLKKMIDELEKLAKR